MFHCQLTKFQTTTYMNYNRNNDMSISYISWDGRKISPTSIWNNLKVVEMEYTARVQADLCISFMKIIYKTLQTNFPIKVTYVSIYYLADLCIIYKKLYKPILQSK